MNAQRTSVHLLIVTVLGLIVLGLVMMTSTSAFAPESHGDPMFLFNRQIKWLGIGVLLCIVAARLDYHLLEKSWKVWYGIAVVLLLLCFVPHIGHSHFGARRWINLGISFQPSEFAKLAGVVALAWCLARDEEQSKNPVRGFLVPFAFGGSLMLLIAPEVDLGTTALIGATTLILMFIAGTRLRFLVPMAVAGIGLLALVIAKMPERTGRFLAFVYPEKYPADFYQQFQGLIAAGSGGVEGLGLGNGRQKAFYLPFAHTDFIFPVVGEELGLRVTLAVVAAFILFLLSGATVAMHARDRFGMLLGFGVTLLVSLQAAVNIGVTTAVLPNKGMPMPFVSYGGTNLVFCLICVGILINIYRQGLTEKEAKSRVALPTRTGRKRVVRL
ncbi:MAG: putative lipid II flippase FtsW [Chthoniobacter sp.]|nr:putative lipid II flippase FtsW [Chthoniobacter sp.]